MANMEEALICVFPNGGKYLLNVLVLSLTAGHKLVHKSGSVAVEKSTLNFI